MKQVNNILFSRSLSVAKRTLGVFNLTAVSALMVTGLFAVASPAWA